MGPFVQASYIPLTAMTPAGIVRDIIIILTSLGVGNDWSCKLCWEIGLDRGIDSALFAQVKSTIIPRFAS